jgi:hypothetical protein
MFFQRNPTIGTRPFDDATFLVDAAHAQLHELNEVGSLIWSLCDGQHSSQQIAQAVVEAFDVTLEEALRDTEAFLSQLREKDLLLPLAIRP